MCGKALYRTRWQVRALASSARRGNSPALPAAAKQGNHVC